MRHSFVTGFKNYAQINSGGIFDARHSHLNLYRASDGTDQTDQAGRKDGVGATILALLLIIAAFED